MKVSFYASVSRTGQVKMTKTKPNVGSDLVIQVNLNIPDEYFRKPQPVVNIDVPRDVANVEAEVLTVKAAAERMVADATAALNPFALPTSLVEAGWKLVRLDGSDAIGDGDMPTCVLSDGAVKSIAMHRTRKAAFDAAVARAERMDADRDSDENQVIEDVTAETPFPYGWEFDSFTRSLGGVWEAWLKRTTPPKKREEARIMGQGLNRTEALRAVIHRADPVNAL